MNTRYEIQNFTLCAGWTNTWFIIEEDNTETPETFASEAEAQQASMNSSAKFRKKSTRDNSHRTQVTASMTSASFPYHHERSGDSLPSPVLPHEHYRFFSLTGFRVAASLRTPSGRGIGSLATAPCCQ